MNKDIAALKREIENAEDAAALADVARKSVVYIEAISAEVERLRPLEAGCYHRPMTATESGASDYLGRLLKNLHPEIELLPDLLGRCTQIENVIAGLLRELGDREYERQREADYGEHTDIHG